MADVFVTARLSGLCWYEAADPGLGQKTGSEQVRQGLGNDRVIL